MKTTRFSLLSAGLGLAILAGCSDLGILSVPEPASQPGAGSTGMAVQVPGPDTVRPRPRPGGAQSGTGLTGAQPSAPKAVPETAQSGELGRSVVSLGDPAQPGLWVETPLVSRVQPGRVIRTDSGKSLAVELRPGPEGGARASLQTLLGLGLSPAALSELVIARP